MTIELRLRICFIAEHGLCFLVEAEGKKLLFDTGQSAKTLVNIHKLGIDLEAVDYAVISHGHYDHAGGYRTLVDNGLHCPLYTGADFFGKRFSNNDGELKYLGVVFDPVYLE